MKIYLAGALFSEADRDWLSGLKRRMEGIGEDVTLIWPYELITHQEVHSLGQEGKLEIFRICKAHLDKVDMLVAVLDGPQVDDGTAWEIGYFYCKYSDRLPIIGIRTDFRNTGETRLSTVNAMIEGSCDRIVSSSEELLEVLRGFCVGE